MPRTTDHIIVRARYGLMRGCLGSPGGRRGSWQDTNPLEDFFSWGDEAVAVRGRFGDGPKKIRNVGRWKVASLSSKRHRKTFWVVEVEKIDVEEYGSQDLSLDTVGRKTKIDTVQGDTGGGDVRSAQVARGRNLRKPWPRSSKSLLTQTV